MLKIEVRENESIDGVLKRFKKEVEKDGILTEEKRHRFFEKPSETRKKKIVAVKRKIQKKLRKLRQANRYV